MSVVRELLLTTVTALTLGGPLSVQSTAATPDFPTEWRGQFESSARKIVMLAEAMPEDSKSGDRWKAWRRSWRCTCLASGGWTPTVETPRP